MAGGAEADRGRAVARLGLALADLERGDFDAAWWAVNAARPLVLATGDGEAAQLMREVRANFHARAKYRVHKEVIVSLMARLKG